MRLLVIDTASDACTVAIATGDGAPRVASEMVGRGHAEILMPMIEKAMAAANLAFTDLDRIAVTTGPGSFTGVRVGLAAARGLALVTGVPAVGISTLAVHAEAARAALGPRKVLAVLAAGRGDVYGATFDADGRETGAARAATAQSFAADWQLDTVVAGSGADLILAALPMDATPAVAHRSAVPDAAALCRLAERATPDGSAPRPLYLKPPDARPQTAARIARR